MKLIKIATIASLGLAAQSSAVIFNISNGGFSVAFTDNSGVPLAEGSGVVAAGVFTGPVDIMTINSTFLGLVNPADPTASTFAVNAPNGQDGVISGSIDGGPQGAVSPFVAATEPATNNIFLVVGNESTLALSTQFAVFDSGEQFTPDLGSPTPDTIAFTPNEGSLVIGSIGEDVPLFDGVVNATNFQLAAVPEPSSALLAGLALVGGLARRRR